MDNLKLGFQSDVTIFVSKNLTPYNGRVESWNEDARSTAAGVIRALRTINDVHLQCLLTLTLLLYTLILLSKDRIRLGWVDQDVALFSTLSLIMITKNHLNIPNKSCMSLQ